MTTKLQQAWLLFRAGDFDAALDLAKKICESEDVGAEATYLFGSCLYQLGQYLDAIDAFKQSLLSKPDSMPVYMSLGAAFSVINDLCAAEEHYKKALHIDPSHLHARVELAKILITSSRFDEAKEQLKSAIDYNKNSGLPYYVLGRLGRQEGALIKDNYQYFLTAVRYEPDVAEYQYALGECLLAQGRYDESKNCFIKANIIDPDRPSILRGLATVSVKQGDMFFAFKQIDKLHKRKVFMPEIAITFLLCCKHVDRCDDAIEYAEICLNDPMLEPEMKRNIHSKLAFVLDIKKQYDQAWHHIVASKDGLHTQESYEPVGYKLFIDSLVEVFNFSNMFNLPRSDIRQACSPIFIIGMPRSGTSLVEQILAAHPEVTGGGELTYLSSMIDNLSLSINSKKLWPHCILDIKKKDINTMAQHYLDSISKLADGTIYVTDKMPHNFYAVGLIRLLFPKAKIIHCTRNPLDTCISIYFQKFQEGHHYSDNLFHLGTHYHQYQQLMNHWKTLSFDMHEIKYEELVSNPKEVISGLLDYCNLDWNENCMKFNEIERYVLTASFDQVRQPLHTNSVNRWQHYDQYLSDLKVGINRGY